ncbi:SGNH/GDSL hydrolase family protein [bacterium]|nr:SGNH/GDSL hydrolase family protein [bacterium]
MQWTACLFATLVLTAGLTLAAEPAPNVNLRGSLANSRLQFETAKKGHVAFMGGSITEMNGYRPMVCASLTKRFPDTEFVFTDAGISSTCSTTGAFRLEKHVLDKGPVDAFFVEFAVNDDQDAGHARRECMRGMEGIVRHLRSHNPHADIVITYFVNPGMLATIQKGKTPLTIGAHEEVAKHYAVSSINLAAETARLIGAGTLTWKQFGGTHPAKHGNAICTAMIDSLLDAAWDGPVAKAKTPHPTPKPLDPQNYERGRLIEPAEAKVKSGWTLGVPDWGKLKGGKRGRFTKETLVHAETAGAELTLDFTGAAIGAYVLAGPDAGILEASVDGKPAKATDLFHRYSRGLHYPRTVVFDADLAPGKHTLTLRVSAKKNAKSAGTAARILAFTAN